MKKRFSPYAAVQTICVFILLFCYPSTSSLAQPILQSNAFAQLGEPAYTHDFTHFNYVNPHAPKGGNITLAVIGTFDNFHRYASRGNAAAGTDLLYDSLFTASEDEPGSLYRLIALYARYPADYRWMEVTLNPQARFHDGSPITAEDVAFTFTTFMQQGVPQFRVLYRGTTASVLAHDRVRFQLPEGNKEKMMSLLQLPIIAKSFWQQRRFDEPLIQPPLASGPYRIVDWNLGQHITYRRVDNYWAADLPVNRGRYNFATLRYDYYLDDNVAFEAFKAGAFDLRVEDSAKRWATQYRGNNFSRRYIVRQVYPHQQATDAMWLAFNNEKPLFQDIRLRQAISLMLDFEWLNRTLFYRAFSRTNSYFQNTEYAARGKPDAKQLAVLAPFRAQLPTAVFTGDFLPPITNGSGYDRRLLLTAQKQLQQAGWTLQKQKLINTKSGKPLQFELLVRSGTAIEWVIPFRHNLARLGIDLVIRQVDSAQFLRRLRQGDYDMIPRTYAASPFPDSGLQMAWQSDYITSSWNTPRVSNPVVDALIKQIVQHQGDKSALLTLGRALDRVLLSQHYMIPMWYDASDRLAYWDKFSMPASKPAYAIGFHSWWYDPVKAARLPAERR